MQGHNAMDGIVSVSRGPIAPNGEVINNAVSLHVLRVTSLTAFPLPLVPL